MSGLAMKRFLVLAAIMLPFAGGAKDTYTRR